MGMWVLYAKSDYKASRKIIVPIEHMLEQVPAPFRKVYVSNREAYARKHFHNTVTFQVLEAFRKEIDR
jgi:hypothetical protein